MSTIENRRFALLVALAVIGFLLYQAWQKDHPPTPPAAVRNTPAVEAPLSATATDDEVPAGSIAPEARQPAGTATVTPKAAARIFITTDVLRAEISTEGGQLQRLELLGYPVAKETPDQNVALLDDRDGRWFVVQSGLAGPGAPVVSHRDTFLSAADRYTLQDGQDVLVVPLEHITADGQRITKRYRFHRGLYQIDLEHQLQNTSAEALTANAYVQLWRTPFSAGDEPPFIQSFMGLGWYEQKNGGDSYRFKKQSFDDLADEPLQLEQNGGWMSMMQHYFLAAVIPPPGEALTFVAKPSNTRGYLAQYIGAARTIEAGAEETFSSRLYIGPKLQRRIAEVAPGLELTVDYGILTPVSEPLFWLLDWFYRLTGNWGVAIILLTLAVKLALYKLSEAQYRSMAKMRKYAPRIQDLKERHSDNREALHKAMMDLYKKEKFNPLAGCWPLLIQFPVFIALYWVLLESVELRQADFALWLNDLSAPDPYYVLPVLFGITMFVQQKLSGTVAMDPMQQRVMSVMPVMLAVFFAFFPVGLVLYWLVSNLIGIAQQWVIVRKLEGEGLGKR